MRTVSRVVGMVAGGREHIVAQVHQGAPVLLKPEPDNRYDRHAIAVYTAPRAVLEHPDELVSSVNSPPSGKIHPDDRTLILDRQAGYLPKELAARLDLPADGVIGWVSAVRYRPPDDRIDGAGNSHQINDPHPVGFDVTAWLEFRATDDTLDADIDADA